LGEFTTLLKYLPQRNPGVLCSRKFRRNHRIASAEKEPLRSPEGKVMTHNFLRGTAVAVLIVLAFAAGASAFDIVNDWGKVQPPPLPEVKGATLDGATTAIIIMDMDQRKCASNARCAATVPAIKRLYEAGRAAGAMFWYSVSTSAKTPEMIAPGFAPKDGEWEPIQVPDKFFRSQLENKLKAHNIKTAILCGHSAESAGIDTAQALAVRGYTVLVPVDCLATSNGPYAPYLEQYAAAHFTGNGPGSAGQLGNRASLTRSTMIKFMGGSAQSAQTAPTGGEASATDIVNDWAKVQPPPVPKLKQVTLDGPTTVLVFTDMDQHQCFLNDRCAATIPAFQRLYAAGRAAGAMFWYSLPPDGAPDGCNGNWEKCWMVAPGFDPKDGEWEQKDDAGGTIHASQVTTKSHLMDKMKARNIKTAILCGHSFAAMVMSNALNLALNGYEVVVPTDCNASNGPIAAYLEQYAAWYVYKSDYVADHSTLTRSTMIKFRAQKTPAVQESRAAR
jgi:nicotinamidase-related amidase